MCKMESKFLVIILLIPGTMCQYQGQYGLPNFQRQRIKNYNNGFVAAGKGDPPPCHVRPGETYCETLKHYPYETILDAIRNSKIDINRLLIDESFDDPPNFGLVNAASRVVTEKVLPGDNFLRGFMADEGSNSEQFLNQTLLGSKKSSLTNMLTKKQSVSTRDKRQSSDAIPNCKFSTRYIYPQTAMCARTGEWMYVINLREFGVMKFSQMVRAEICDVDVVGKPCMGDCANSNLPFATSSVCEQHYLQKRLISMSTKDMTIVSEMFWLPTCCVCKTFRVM